MSIVEKNTLISSNICYMYLEIPQYPDVRRREEWTFPSLVVKEVRINRAGRPQMLHFPSVERTRSFWLFTVLKI